MRYQQSLARVGLTLILTLTTVVQLNAQSCSRKMGPYFTIYQAELAAQQAKYSGYQTSGVYGVGGLYSDSSNRRYFFNVFFPC